MGKKQSKKIEVISEIFRDFQKLSETFSFCREK